MGLTQEELSRLIGIRVRPISRCENGHTELSFNNEQAARWNRLLREQLGMTIEDIPGPLSSRQPVNFSKK